MMSCCKLRSSGKRQNQNLATRSVREKRSADAGSGGGSPRSRTRNGRSWRQSSSWRLLRAGERSQPAVQGRGGAGAELVVVARGRGEAAGGARVRGEDAGDLTQRDGVGAEVQVERSGAPDAAPPGGEDLRAAAVLGGETRDDLAEDGVG